MIRRVRKLAAMVAIATVYVAAAKLGLRLAVVHPYATAVWAPSGIALAALLIYGRSVWPGIYIGAFIANLTNGGTATPQTIAVAAAIASGNTLEALAGGWLT
jgi:integral membrane sensor domain MASE1